MRYLTVLFVILVTGAYVFGQSFQTGPLAKGVNQIAFQGSGTASITINALAATTVTNVTIPVTGVTTNNIPSITLGMSGTFPAGLTYNGAPSVVASGTVAIPIYNTTALPISSTNVWRATVFVPLVNP